MASFSTRKVDGRYYARIADKGRTPARKSWPLKTTQKMTAQVRLNKLRKAYDRGDWNPWEGGWLTPEPMPLKEANDGNHVLATCLWGTELGLECGALHFPQPVTEHVLHNLRALSTTHPNLHLIGHRAQLPVEMFKVKLKEWLNTNPGVYYIPGGGSSPVGVLGYVAAAFELVDQYAEMDEPLPDVVVVAAGTCGTFSGLRLGFELAEVPIRVIGVRVVDKIVANVPLATHLANRTAALMEDYGAGELPRLRHADIEILDGFLGDDYGVPTASGLRAIQRMERADGLHLEPTYTGKAFGALLDRVRDFRGRRVLYWHTLSSADLGARIDASNVARDLPDEYMDYFEELA